MLLDIYELLVYYEIANAADCRTDLVHRTHVYAAYLGNVRQGQLLQ